MEVLFKELSRLIREHPVRCAYNEYTTCVGNVWALQWSSHHPRPVDNVRDLWLPSAAARHIMKRRTGGYIIWGVRRLDDCTTVVG
jgi:hypothetical protein